jgi:hypothetical protein
LFEPRLGKKFVGVESSIPVDQVHNRAGYPSSRIGPRCVPIVAVV